jgi:DNA-directed RNA polymerase subunit RPC12/RpoP
MIEYYQCFTCQKVMLVLPRDGEKKCPSCSRTTGRVLSQVEFDNAYKEGALFNTSDLPRAKRRQYKG